MADVSHAWWTGSLACTIAWYLATGRRELLVEAYNDYLKRGASPDVRAHLEAIHDGRKGKR